MKLESASYLGLPNHDDRTTAHFAAVARGDTIHGGARALVIAGRLLRMNPRSNAVSIVGDVYSASTGRWHTEFEAWHCPECGCVHLGQDAAFKCCHEKES